MDPMKIALLIREIYRLADELGIVDYIGDHIYSKKPEELVEAQNRLSFLLRLLPEKDD